MRVLILDFFSLLMAFSCVFHLNAQYHFDIELLKTGKIIPASSINTSANESSPILDNEKIYFISDRNDTPFDVYTAQYVKGIITDITLLGGKMNSSQHEGPICRCNGKLYFSRSVQKSINGVKTDGVQLMVEERGKVKALNSTKNLMHITCSEKNMYAVEIKSNRTTDIVKIDETGKIIADESLNILNSNSNDAFPSLIHDSLMVFASKRPGGYGGFDLYFSFMKNNQWSSPKLLPPPFNTPFDDVSLTMFSDGRTGMISSNRPGGKGGDDIYFWAVDQPIIQYTKPIEMATFELVLTDKLTSDPVVGSFVKLYKVLDDKSLETLRRLKIDNFESNDSVAPKTIAYYVDPSPILLKSNDVGSVKTSLPSHEHYVVEVVSSSHDRLYYLITAEQWTRIKDLALPLSPIDYKELSESDIEESNSKILGEWEVRGISINGSSISFSKEAQQSLSNIMDLVKNSQNFTMDIVAYSDARGNTIQNLKRTEELANSLKKWFIFKGVNPTLIQTAGLGDAKVLNQCTKGVSCTERDHNFNNRVEITLTSNP